MKKLLLIAAALTATTASAASLTQTVQVTANVVNACQVAGVTDGSFTYDAINGITNATNATATFSCNRGTVPTLETPQTGALTFGTSGLDAEYEIDSDGGLNDVGGTDTTFTVEVSADAEQWDVTTSTTGYVANLEIKVTF
ncbi:hypothetical protein [Deinococcus sp. JMULE3]|uniref:hypothetical protein n=1 Tax=Deinococcus sp. JMULE3 TaxID=2518341 RepID=UPI001575F180|nr:hypothetical protein [Deinococcus sp. JMULE3]NTY02612.1 hypothetical protein [Deinococcus sp. JMULE3]